MHAALEVTVMAGDKFFSEPRENSLVKTKIVSKYFWVWAKIITRKTTTDRIAYIDLFAGPGRYEDGTKSTPLLVLEEAIKSDEYGQKLVVLLNDGEPTHASSLQNAINSLPGIRTLKYTPQVEDKVVGDEITAYLESTRLVPTFCFIDPWGYKGLSLRLVNAVVKDFACECLFFFNYNRINMGITNEAVDPHIKALFGDDRTERMKADLRANKYVGDVREAYVLENLTEALIEMGRGQRYILPFRFRNEKGNRTSHYLIFVSKHRLGYGIMKGIMAGESSKKEEGVASFEYSVADSRFPLLFELNRPLSDLVEMLPEDFAGQSLSVEEICDRHNVGRPYVIENYQEACRRLEAAGRIGVSKPAAARRKRNGVVTFAKHLVITFPPRKK